MTLEDRFSMTAEKYLAKHHLLVYLEDSISQLLEHREENPKVNAIKFLSEYFNSLKDGNHTMFREYSFVHATPHNRASFVRLFWKCYRQIGRKGDDTPNLKQQGNYIAERATHAQAFDLLSIQEYHSLVSLICTDFPSEPVQKTARIILLDDALDCLISFPDFIYAFQVQFFYEEFIEKCQEIYQSLQQTQRSPRDPVVVPSGSDDKDAKVHQNNHHHSSDGVDAMQYFRAVYPLCGRSNFSTPPGNCLKEILFNVPRISFYGFLMALAKSESINENIGKLPQKHELLEGADSELTTNGEGIESHVVLAHQQAINSPTIRRKDKGRPLSAIGSNSRDSPSSVNPNVYSTQPQTTTSTPSNSSRGKVLSRNSNKTNKSKKKESSDESSDDTESDDSSDDTN